MTTDEQFEQMQGPTDPEQSTANATWSRMLAGNRRFAEGKPEHPWQDTQTRESLIDRQNPDAAVLSCSDSRVPPEIVFDQGLGDLFTVRTAGQVVDDGVLASLEYAVSELNVSLLVVLGHQGCGAVHMAMDGLDAMLHEATADADDSLAAAELMDSLDERIAESESIIMRLVGMSVWQAREAELEAQDDIERVHVASTIENLVSRSEVIQTALAEDRLMLVGARYQLDTGLVEVLSF
ncbi:carbonic anhydrase [Bifidobacterium callitrichos DSM 23973]|uniref:Carbonic anhydrase n=2 Tax=Bifidobacterium callitrichos TaxID=762209 RepID=A0A087A049_9BIFI|nr:carbonic anhydrase [Bifidobacterium callitrichos DSM 23973]